MRGNIVNDSQFSDMSPESEPSPDPSAGRDAVSRTSPEASDPTVSRGLTKKGRVRSTRASGAWVSVIIVALLVIAMLIFIGQNSQKVTLNFLAFNGRFPLGLTVLFAAVAGVLLVALPGTARIIELRRALRRNEKDKHAR